MLFPGITNDARLQPRGNSPKQGQPVFIQPQPLYVQLLSKIRLSDAELSKC